jgi:hypothetical protein
VVTQEEKESIRKKSFYLHRVKKNIQEIFLDALKTTRIEEISVAKQLRLSNCNFSKFQKFDFFLCKH